METLLPPGWQRPKGYANGIKASGQMIFVAGQIGWDENERFLCDTITGQFEQVIKNTLAVLKAGGAGPEHIVRMTWYVTDRQAYKNNIRDIGRIYRDYIGKNFPAMAVVEVSGLIEDKALIEIETTAILP